MQFPLQASQCYSLRLLRPTTLQAQGGHESGFSPFSQPPLSCLALGSGSCWHQRVPKGSLEEKLLGRNSCCFTKSHQRVHADNAAGSSHAGPAVTLGQGPRESSMTWAALPKALRQDCLKNPYDCSQCQGRSGGGRGLTLNPGGPCAPGKPATPGFPLFPAGPMRPGSPSFPCSPWKASSKGGLSCLESHRGRTAWLGWGGGGTELGVAGGGSE